ncbi:MAG: hypothetical protein ACP5G0_04840 [Desulfomonilia bacterium]
MPVIGTPEPGWRPTERAGGFENTMGRKTTAVSTHNTIFRILNINPQVREMLQEFGETGENAFDVYTLYKSAANRHFSEIVRVDDCLDMRCLAWMSRDDFIEARRLLKRLGLIIEIMDQTDRGSLEIRHIKLIPVKGTSS